MESLIHEKSAGIPLPRFDLFSVPPTQQTIEKHIITEHKPISALDSSSFVQFEIHTSFDEYLDLSKLFLYLKLKQKVQADLSEKSANWALIKHSNYFMHAMIKQLDIFIGSTQVSSSTPTYAYKAYIEGLLGFSESAKKSHLSASAWDEEKYLSLTYEPFELYGRLHSDLVFQDRVLLGGCKLTIRILFNDPKFYFISNGTIKPDLEYLDANLHVIRYKVTQGIVQGHDAALKITPAKYILSSARVKSFTINKGLSDCNIDNVHSGQLPRRIFIMFVSNDAFNGSYSEDPFKFEHQNLNSIAVYVNGEQIPPKPYTPDYTHNLFMREMLSLFESLDMIDGESNININRSNYSKKYTIYGFNLAQDYSNGPGAVGYVNPLRYGSMSLSVKFSSALTKALTCLVYYEFDKLLEIDINREAKIDLY